MRPPLRLEDKQKFCAIWWVIYCELPEKLKASKTERISTLASVAFDVAKIKPHKKKRLKFLARENQELLLRLEETGLIMAHHY